jgi:hypothetical protein
VSEVGDRTSASDFFRLLRTGLSSSRTSAPPRRAQWRSVRLQREGQARENPPTRSELWRADTDAGAIAELVHLVEQVDGIEPCRQLPGALNLKRVCQPGIDLCVKGQAQAIRDTPASRDPLSGQIHTGSRR